MRPQNKRGRGRNGGGNPYHNPNNNNRPRQPHRSQTFDSNGPNVKIRGNAYQVYERYLALAREAQSSGDRIASENFFQHAEHYFRVMSAAGEGFGGQPRPQQPMSGDGEMGPGEMGQGEGDPSDGEQPVPVHVQHAQPRQMGEQEYRQEIDDAVTPANRQPDVDDDQLPSFITGRSD